MRKWLTFIFVACVLIGCTSKIDINSELPTFKGIEILEDGNLAIYTPPSAEVFFIIDTNTIWLEVDLSEQILLVHIGKDTTSMFSISSGLSSTPTPTGSYRVYKMHSERTIWSNDGKPQDASWMMLFHDEYAIHGTSWHNNFGTPMSRGCVNMNMIDAKTVFSQSEIGTHVYIHQ